jgi:hypothetical protein
MRCWVRRGCLIVSSRHRIVKGAIDTLYSLVVNSNDMSSHNHFSSICYVSCDIRTMWCGGRERGHRGDWYEALAEDSKGGPGKWGPIRIRGAGPL